jgi:hypothetical protein
MVYTGLGGGLGKKGGSIYTLNAKIGPIDRVILCIELLIKRIKCLTFASGRVLQMSKRHRYVGTSDHRNNIKYTLVSFQSLFPK